jgi:ubiquinone/menaquinone biosynthesis C-methylase UbiE
MEGTGGLVPRMALYYDRIANIYDATRAMPPAVDKQVTKFILRLVKVTAATKFLEPGIGTGLNAVPIIKKGYSYTGVDISGKMLDQLRQKLPKTPNNLTLLEGEASSMPFGDHSFDVIITRHMLHLVPNWRKALREFRRVLKPSGVYLYCESPWTPHQKEFEEQWQLLLAQQEGFQPACEPEDPVSLETVKNWFLALGATVETVTAAQWRVEQTVGELLDIYETRDHGSCWSIPNAAFPGAMREFRTWCQTHYGSEEVSLSSNATFDITVIRNLAR